MNQDDAQHPTVVNPEAIGDPAQTPIVQMPRIVHESPPDGSGLMPCCGRTPFEVPQWHRMTSDAEQVTCGK